MKKPFEEPHRDSNPDPLSHYTHSGLLLYQWVELVKPHIRIPMVIATKIHASTPDSTFSLMVLGAGHSTKFRRNRCMGHDGPERN